MGNFGNTIGPGYTGNDWPAFPNPSGDGNGSDGFAEFTNSLGSGYRLGNFGLSTGDLYKWDKAMNAYNADFAITSAAAAMEFEAQQAALNRTFQSESAQKAMEFESNEARIAREWEEKMSNTAYQRAMADMKAAGLNPILAYQQGGASTPNAPSVSGFAASGSSASGYAAQMSGTRDILKTLVNALTSVFSSSSSGILGALGKLIK